MMKVAVIAIVIAACIFESTATKCYVGYSAAGLPLATGVRNVECETGFDYCTTIKYRLGGIEVTQGNCARKYGQAMCQFMRNPHPAMTECEESLCRGDNCNTAVNDAEQVERKRVGPYKNTLKCVTGLQTKWPAVPFASADVPMAVDECFPGTTKCVTVKYDYIYQFETKVATKKNKFYLPTVHKMCNRHNIDKCEKWCTILSIHQNMRNCKVKCCNGHKCNA